MNTQLKHYTIASLLIDTNHVAGAVDIELSMSPNCRDYYGMLGVSIGWHVYTFPDCSIVIGYQFQSVISLLHTLARSSHARVYVRVMFNNISSIALAARILPG